MCKWNVKCHVEPWAIDWNPAISMEKTCCRWVFANAKDHCTGGYNDGDWSILAEKKKLLYKEFALVAPAVPAGKRILMSQG